MILILLLLWPTWMNQISLCITCINYIKRTLSAKPILKLNHISHLNLSMIIRISDYILNINYKHWYSNVYVVRMSEEKCHAVPLRATAATVWRCRYVSRTGWLYRLYRTEHRKVCPSWTDIPRSSGCSWSVVPVINTDVSSVHRKKPDSSLTYFKNEKY